jgi:tetratricopeptide (TPR) repeat protein
MNRLRSLSIAALCIAASIGVAHASWYDDYDAGVKAARAGNWQLVISSMTKAIAGQPNENNRARTYGAIFINYHPYYYRGVAYSNTGKYQQAITDFEKTSGPGEFDMGPLGTLIADAKRKLAEADNPPAPVPVPVPIPQPPVPVPVPVPVPQPPSLDPVLRSQADAALGEARQALDRARQRRATNTQQYANAMSEFSAANTRQARARSNQELRDVIAQAQNAELMADSAVISIPTPVPQPQPGGGGEIPVWSGRVRVALERYFQGEFDLASEAFDQLTKDAELRRNAWIWAFLGASKYSQYAFNTEASDRDAAMRAFQEARRLGFGRDGLPEKYFSRRIREAFRTSG